MYIISSGYNGKHNGMIINALVQVTAFPNQIIASVNKESLTLEYIEKSGLFNITVLDKDAPLQLIGLFGFQTGKKIDKFSHRLTQEIFLDEYILENDISTSAVRSLLSYHP